MTDQKGEGLHSLGLKTFALCRPPIEPHKDHQTLLYRIIELIRRRIAEKTAPYGEENGLDYVKASAHTSVIATAKLEE